MTDKQLIIEDHQRLAKWERLIRHLGISMSVISGEQVRTEAVTSIPAPAATAMETYSSWRTYGTKQQTNRYHTMFNTSVLPGDDLGVWLGIAWHELGHVLWSPYTNQIPINIAFNLLEDARIEGLLLGTYPNTRGALMSMLGWMLSMPDVHGTPNQDHIRYQYAWMCGRSHLPKKLRKKQRKLVDTGIAKQMDSIFKEYLSMGDTLDQAKAGPLVKKLMDILLGEAELGNIDAACRAISNTDHDTASGTMVDLSDLDDMDTDDTDEGTDTDDKATRGHDGKVIPSPEAMNESKDIADEMVKELETLAKEDEQLSKEVARLEVLVKAGGNSYADAGGSMVPPTGVALDTASKVRRIAARFNDESGKGLVRRRDYGRIKPNRYERTEDIDTAYDMWEPGLDQEMYVSLLVDVSGSMYDTPVNNIVYALEQGLSDVATVETVYFNNRHWIAPQPSTPHRMSKITPSGGTNPTSGMGYIYPRIIGSSAANRILVVYTDGQFGGFDAYQVMGAYIDACIEKGINVRLVADDGGGESLRRLQRNNTSLLKEENIYQVSSLDALPDIVLEWTKDILSRPIGAW